MPTAESVIDLVLFGTLLPCNFDECKLLLILNNNWQESPQEPNVNLEWHRSSCVVRRQYKMGV
jgi:hypothetical protein